MGACSLTAITAESAAPLGLASAIGIVLALTELLPAFRRSAVRALFSKWGLLLLGVNAAAAAAVYLVLVCLVRPGSNHWLTAVVSGFMYPVLLRTNFRWYQKVGDKSSASAIGIGLDRLYTLLQEHCLNEFNVAVANDRRRAAEQVASRFDDGELSRRIQNHIDAYPDAARQLRANGDLTSLRVRYAGDPERLRYNLAVFLIDQLPLGETKKMLRGK